MNIGRSMRSLVLVGLGAIAGGTLVAYWGAHREAGAVLGREPERVVAGEQAAEPASIKGFTKGKGWGWIWGKDDEVGALDALVESIAGGGAFPCENGRSL